MAKEIHIELTTKCNIHCEFCLRKHSNFYELPFEDITNFLNNELLQDLNEIKLCGGLGEPTLHKDFVRLMEYFKKGNPNIHLSISTNGSTHTKEWWYDLAKILNSNDEVTFGIDGIEETHKIHRSSDYKTVLENIKYFISGGGVANWQTIVFKHNQHQLDDMQKIATTIGANFEPKMSGFYNETFENPTIEVDARPSFVHKTRKVSEDACFDKEEKCDLIYKRPFLSVKGFLYPCPFLRAYDELNGNQVLVDPKFLIEFLKNKKDLSIKENSYDKIVASKLYNWVLENRAKLKTCKTYCGVCDL